jgi:hypothetical protein
MGRYYSREGETRRRGEGETRRRGDPETSPFTIDDSQFTLENSPLSP